MPNHGKKKNLKKNRKLSFTHLTSHRMHLAKTKKVSIQVIFKSNQEDKKLEKKPNFIIDL